MSRTRRTAVGATVALLVGGALAGCGSGLSAETATERPVTHGVEGKVGNVSVHNAFLVPDDGSDHVSSGSGAYLAMVVVNSGTDAATLQSVSADGFGSATVSGAGTTPSAVSSPPPLPSNSPRQSAPATVPLPSGSASASATASPSPSASESGGAGGGSVPLPSGTPVSFVAPVGGSGGNGGNGATVHLSGASGDLRPTQAVRVTLDFGDVGTLTLKVPVEPAYGTTQAATPIPTESPTTPTEIVPPGGSPTPSPSETPVEIPVSVTPQPTHEVTVAPTPSGSKTP